MYLLSTLILYRVRRSTTTFNAQLNHMFQRASSSLIVAKNGYTKTLYLVIIRYTRYMI